MFIDASHGDKRQHPVLCPMAYRTEPHDPRCVVAVITKMVMGFQAVVSLMTRDARRWLRHTAAPHGVVHRHMCLVLQRVFWISATPPSDFAGASPCGLGGFQSPHGFARFRCAALQGTRVFGGLVTLTQACLAFVSVAKPTILAATKIRQRFIQSAVTTGPRLQFFRASKPQVWFCSALASQLFLVPSVGFSALLALVVALHGESLCLCGHSEIVAIGVTRGH